MKWAAWTRMFTVKWKGADASKSTWARIKRMLNHWVVGSEGKEMGALTDGENRWAHRVGGDA